MKKELYVRNLPVPYFNQRNNSYRWQYVDIETNKTYKWDGKDAIATDTCNVTCLAMVLNYLGVSRDTPDEIMRKIFEPSAGDSAELAKKKKTPINLKVMKVFIPVNFLGKLRNIYMG
jgi:hypothetical protein